MEVNKIKEFYEGFNEYLIRDKINFNPRHLKIFDLLEDIFKFYKVQSAFEIGCGIGIISEFIRKKIPIVYSIDLSEENIKFAKQTVKNVNFQSVDILELKAERKFDLITLFDVLEHIPQDRHVKVFEKIKEISKDETIIAITIPDPDFLSYMRKHQPGQLQIVDQSLYFNDLIRLFDNFNLELIKYEKYGIDYQNQYRYYLLKYKKNRFTLTVQENNAQKGILQFYKKVIRKLKSYIRKIRFRKILNRKK